MKEFARTTPVSGKIKIYSYVLAIGYLLFGAVLFHVLPKFQILLTEFDVPPNFLTSVTLIIGSGGWFCLAMGMAACIILKDVKSCSRPLNPLFTLGLLFWLGCMAYALYAPLFYGVRLMNVH